MNSFVINRLVKRRAELAGDIKNNDEECSPRIKAVLKEQRLLNQTSIKKQVDTET